MSEALPSESPSVGSRKGNTDSSRPISEVQADSTTPRGRHGAHGRFARRSNSVTSRNSRSSRGSRGSPGNSEGSASGTPSVGGRRSRKGSFSQGDFSPSLGRHRRREAMHISVDQLGDGRSGHASPANVRGVLEAERDRLKKKISSRAYENDTQGVLMEKRLREGKIVDPGKDQREVTGRAASPDSIGEGDMALYTDDPNALKEYDPMELIKYLGRVSPLKWVSTFIAGAIIAFLATAIIMGSHNVSTWKMGVIEDLSQTGYLRHFYVYLFLLAYALPCCSIAALLVTYVAPHAGGSGIPEIKAYLNGINMPQAFTFQTWFSRSLGLFLVTSSGMFAGTEGPFAHLGGIVASAFADGPRPCSQRGWWPRVLHGHRNRCEFISKGAAMGVAAAFGAPVGGILFSLEEASSYWSKELTWQAFFGTMVAAVLAKFSKSGFTSISGPGFIEFPNKEASFENWELGTFAVLGLVTGLTGALFCNTVHVTITIRRRVFKLGSPTATTRRMRLLEVVCIVVLTATVCLWPAVMAGCDKLPEGSGVSGHRRLVDGDTGPPDISGGICPSGEYSTMGYILLTSKEAVIKTLFSESMADGATMGVGHLLGCFVIVWITTIVTFGSAMPVGLFIPNILAGACLGRAMGQQLRNWEVDVHQGVYALIGAAGALAGFSRVTISLAVIFLEITNNMNLLLPLMLVIMTAKQVADRFGPSVYDIVLESNPEVHILEDSLSEDHLLILANLSVHDVATSEIVVLRAFEPVEKIMKLLVRTSYSGYPVVDIDGRLIGLIPRTKLVTLVHDMKDKVGKGELIPFGRSSDSAPEVTYWNTPVVRAFRHFRACGLQHLCVVDQSHTLLGLLTRTDFAQLCRSGHEGVEAVREIMHRKQAAAAAGQLIEPVKPTAPDATHKKRPSDELSEASDNTPDEKVHAS